MTGYGYTNFHQSANPPYHLGGFMMRSEAEVRDAYKRMIKAVGDEKSVEGIVRLSLIIGALAWVLEGSE